MIGFIATILIAADLLITCSCCALSSKISREEEYQEQKKSSNGHDGLNEEDSRNK